MFYLVGNINLDGPDLTYVRENVPTLLKSAPTNLQEISTNENSGRGNNSQTAKIEADLNNLIKSVEKMKDEKNTESNRYSEELRQLKDSIRRVQESITVLEQNQRVIIIAFKLEAFLYSPPSIVLLFIKLDFRRHY